jgi:hypothetical protein
MRAVAYIFIIFLMYTVAFAPAIYLHNYCPLLLQHVRLCMIFDYILNIVSVCAIISLVALVLKLYRIAFLFAVVPLFVEAVVLCSALLLFMFHKELTAAMVRGKIKAIGSGVFNILSAPLKVLSPFNGGGSPPPVA